MVVYNIKKYSKTTEVNTKNGLSKKFSLYLELGGNEQWVSFWGDRPAWVTELDAKCSCIINTVNKNGKIYYNGKDLKQVGGNPFATPPAANNFLTAVASTPQTITTVVDNTALIHLKALVKFFNEKLALNESIMVAIRESGVIGSDETEMLKEIFEYIGE